MDEFSENLVRRNLMSQTEWNGESSESNFLDKYYPSGGDALRGHTRSHPEHDG